MEQPQQSHAREDALALAAPKRARRTFQAAPDSAHLPLSMLPMDVLALLLSFIPLRPRLAIVSLVCKRWHDAVRRGLQHLTAEWTRHPTSTLPLLPSITSLKVDGLVERDLPPSLRCLYVLSPPASRHLRFTALEHLHCARELGYADELLQANASSLRSIALENRDLTHLPLPMPRLRALRLRTLCPDMIACIANIATQLEELSIPFLGSLLRVSFPELRSLTLYDPIEPDSEAAHAAFLSHCRHRPAHVHFRIEADFLTTDFLLLAPYITSLVIQAHAHTLDIRMLSELGSQCCRLTRLRCINSETTWNGPDVEAFTLSHLGRLRRFQAAHINDSLATALCSAANLYRIDCSSLLQLPPTAVFPHVRKLKHWLGPLQWTVIRAYLHALLRSFPGLRVFLLSMTCNHLPATALPSLRKFLHAAERQGVERVYLGNYYGISQVKTIQAEFRGWLQVTVLYDGEAEPTIGEQAGNDESSSDDAVNSEEITED